MISAWVADLETLSNTYKSLSNMSLTW